MQGSAFCFATPSGPNHLVDVGISKGEWHTYEFHFVANTPGVYNGLYRMWTDGVLVHEATDIGYFDTGITAKFDTLYFNPTYGGGSNPVPADQYLDIDEWYMSGRIS